MGEELAAGLEHGLLALLQGALGGEDLEIGRDTIEVAGLGLGISEARERELFVEASKRVLSALSARVRIENEILYPLALACGTLTLREAGARTHS
jgi:hypothetical protein